MTALSSPKNPLLQFKRHAPFLGSIGFGVKAAGTFRLWDMYLSAAFMPKGQKGIAPSVAAAVVSAASTGVTEEQQQEQDDEP